jgi:hypothetical protein
MHAAMAAPDRRNALMPFEICLQPCFAPWRMDGERPNLRQVAEKFRTPVPATIVI